ncbi:uncharacterized protein [Magallana gigas]|uniref:uncharacterized protein isoform X1 n=1 Tax=Magallana gigas TaxID=29159 RepID=UPI0033417ACB
MAFRGLHVFLVQVFGIFLAIYSNSAAETVRRLEKPLLQTIAMTTYPLNDSSSTYTGYFRGPADTEIKNYRGTVDVITQGENNMFEAVFTNRKYKYDQWITLKSTSTRETVNLISNNNYDMRAQTIFVENSCEVGVEKYERGDITEYVATVRNCAAQDKLSTYFSCLLVDQSGGSIQWGSRDLNYPGSPTIREYFKYVDTYYTRSEKGVYYAVLNYPAMKADNITLERFGFVLYVIEPNYSAIAASHYWFYNI